MINALNHSRKKPLTLLAVKSMLCRSNNLTSLDCWGSYFQKDLTLKTDNNGRTYAKYASRSFRVTPLMASRMALCLEEDTFGIITWLPCPSQYPNMRSTWWSVCILGIYKNAPWSQVIILLYAIRSRYCFNTEKIWTSFVLHMATGTTYFTQSAWSSWSSTSAGIDRGVSPMGSESAGMVALEKLRSRSTCFHWVDGGSIGSTADHSDFLSSVYIFPSWRYRVHIWSHIVNNCCMKFRKGNSAAHFTLVAFYTRYRSSGTSSIWCIVIPAVGKATSDILLREKDQGSMK